ncbi:MAG: EscU/YscU/HrcU family type III secretion system export apparatus switch protein, partial [Rhodospirillum sp.]|nr:EscU/YscU/HrcU family type III secretion system export apparatus switch protein [Rhodospirillum sp.]
MSEERNRPTTPRTEARGASGQAKSTPRSGPKSTAESAKNGGDEQTVAVALDYDPTSPLSAPRVVASGRGAVAEQILELAFAHGVKVRQDADLVQILSAVDMDSEIPLEAFAAVAEILAYVYRANGRMAENQAALSGSSAAAFAAAMADGDPGPPAPPPTTLSPL